MRFCTAKRLLVKVIEYGKSEVSLLMDIKFLVMPGTTRTSFKERVVEGKKLPTWEIGIEAPLPTITQSLPEYAVTLSSCAASFVMWAVAPEFVYQSVSWPSLMEHVLKASTRLAAFLVGA